MCVGRAASAIIEAAETTPRLIVMGTHGHGAVMHVLMGNVAERVVRTAACPVLTVREPRERELAKRQLSKLAVGATVLFAALLLAPAMAAAQETATMKQSVPGAEFFRTYCRLPWRFGPRRGRSRVEEAQPANHRIASGMAGSSRRTRLPHDRRQSAGARARRPRHAGMGRRAPEIARGRRRG